MQIRTIFASLALLALISSVAMSQSLVSEPFDYPATIDGLGAEGNGWGGPWAIDPTADGKEGLATVASNVFSYDDLNWVIPDTGNHVQVNHVVAWEDAQRYLRPLAQAWPNEAGATYWVSYLLDVQEPLPIGNAYFMIKLYSGASELLSIGKGGGRDANPPVFTCGSGWPGNEGDDVSDVEIVGGPVWLVVRMDMAGSGAPVRTFMWVDPDPSVEPDTATAAVSRNTTADNGFDTVALEYGGDGAWKLIFDEIRVASDYSDLSAVEPAGTVAMEPFEYTPTIDGLGSATDGWGGSWAIDTTANGKEGLATLASNVFSYDDLNWVLPDTGNHLQVTHVVAWEDAQRYTRPLAQTWPNEAGATYWVSYLLDVQEPLPVGNAYFMIKLYSGADELLSIGKGGGRDANPPVFTCGSGWPGNEGDDVSDVEIVGGPVWLVVRMDMAGSGVPVRTFMWVDPDPSVEPDTATAAVSRNTTADNGFDTVALEYGGDGAWKLIFDEIRLSGSYSDLSIVTSVEEAEKNLPDRFSLAQNYPNPFNPETNITFQLEQPEKVTLAIFNITGQKVRDLILNEQRAGGSHVVRWDGRDNFGNRVSTGVYIYRLQTTTQSLSQKMLMLK